MSRFSERIDRIVKDRNHGSSTLVGFILDALSGDSEGSLPTATQRRWALSQLRAIDRSMVVVHHLLDHLDREPAERFPDCLREYADHWSDSPQRVAQRLANCKDWSGQRILLHSRSGMVREVVAELHRQFAGIEFWQTRSMPGGEGERQYQDLRQDGLSCHLLDDARVAAMAPDLDAGWIGLDQFDRHSFINKVGSNTLASSLLGAGKPVFVLGDTRKQVSRVGQAGGLFERVPFRPGMVLVTESELVAWPESDSRRRDPKPPTDV